MKIEISERENMLPIIKSDRLILRDISLSDITQDYIDWLNDYDTVKFLEIRLINQTRERVEAYIRQKLLDTSNCKHFGIYDNNGSRLVGTITIPEINYDLFHSTAGISFVIGNKDVQGMGYATEALKSLTYYMFNYTNIEKLWGGYYDGHTATEKIFKKCGFIYEARLKKQLINYKGERVDRIFVGLLRDEYLEYTHS
jgi:[ribosomal protein S5]-alanine N-acetyltransferase